MKFSQGVFHPTNTSKYIGDKLPIYRSSWELSFARMCDEHPSITRWASEPLRIPYQHPLTGQVTVYVPDFLIEYVDSKNRKHVEIVEIKPASQTYIKEAKSQRDKIAVAVNMAKWKSASIFCKKRGIHFRVLTENEIFANYKKKRG